MTKFKKYLAVFAVTVLLVSAFAPGLILSAQSVGSTSNDVLYYTNLSGWARTTSATSWSDEESYWAWARVTYNGTTYDYEYDADLPYAYGGSGYSAIADAVGPIMDSEYTVNLYCAGSCDYGFGGSQSQNLISVG